MNRFTIGCALLLVGILGAVLFFPFNYEDRYTCLYHRFSDRGESALNRSLTGTIQRRDGDHAHQHMGDIHSLRANSNDTEDLVRRYVFPFGLFWWGSLAIFTAGCFLFRSWLKTSRIAGPDRRG
jgi:hypothetical protein